MSEKTLFYSRGETNEGPAFHSEKNPAGAKYKKPGNYLSHPDAIVIGSGIGGLATASLLSQRRGFKVLVLEAGATPGGATACHEINGFEFPKGIDSIGDLDPAYGKGLYRSTCDRVTGGFLRWARMPDLHEIAAFGSEVFNWYSSPEKNIEWIEKRFPGEGDPRRYYDLEDRLGRRDFSWALTKLLPTALSRPLYSLCGGEFRRYLKRSAYDIFRRELGFSEALTGAFCYMYGNMGVSPDRIPYTVYSLGMSHYRHGAYFPVGGPSQIPNCIVRVIESHGGQVAPSSPVVRILSKDNRAIGVRLQDGVEIRSPIIISDASAYVTFQNLIEPDLAARHGFAEKFHSLKSSPSHIYLYLGYDEALDLPAQIIWHMPSYPDVPQWDLSKADRLFKSEMRLRGMGCYILSPSARDPSHAERYPGKSTIKVLMEAVPEWVEKYRQSESFRRDFAAEASEALLQNVYRHMPQVKGKKPTVRQCGIGVGCNPHAWNGASLGLEMNEDRLLRHSFWLKPKTPIQGLYLTGQDAFVSGFANSTLSARFTYAAITGDWTFVARREC